MPVIGSDYCLISRNGGFSHSERVFQEEQAGQKVLVVREKLVSGRLATFAHCVPQKVVVAGTSRAVSVEAPIVVWMRGQASERGGEE